MNAVRSLSCLALGLLLPASAASQTVDEIVARHLAARGGREALAAVRSVRMTGRAIAGPGRQAVVTREVARPGLIRTEFVFQGTTGVFAWDGTVGWKISPLEGGFEPEAMTAEEEALAADQADLDGPLVDWKRKGHTIALEAKDALPGGPTHRLKVTLASGAVRRLFLDTASGQVVRAEATRKLRGHEVTVETDFGDYRETGGVTFARSIEAGVRGRPRRLRILVDAVVTNLPVDPERFRKPM